MASLWVYATASRESMSMMDRPLRARSGRQPEAESTVTELGSVAGLDDQGLQRQPNGNAYWLAK
jgi:hypothetical protein